MEITSTYLDEKLNELSARKAQDRKNERYYLGYNPHINDKRPAKEPDNRVPIPFAKMAVEDLLGYAARPGDIKIEISPKDGKYTDNYPDIMKEILDYNEDDLNISELYEDTLYLGRAAEAYWVNPELKISGTQVNMPEFKRVECQDVIFEFTNDIKKKVKHALRFYEYEGFSYCELYTESETIIYKRDKKSWIVEERSYLPYTKPAMIKYVASRFELSVFNAETPIIDTHDELVSKSSNEVDRFNGLILMLPEKVRKEIIDKLVEFKVFDELGAIDGDKWPRYLEKNIAGIEGFYNTFADRLERLFHKSMKIPDMSDENFAGNASGVAIAFKLIGLEFKAARIDSYFDKGLYQKIDFINEAILSRNTETLKTANVNADPSKYDINVIHHRNLPVDTESKVRIAQMLTGIISKETLLRWLPEQIVNDVEKELELLDGEKESQPEIITDNDMEEPDTE